MCDPLTKACEKGDLEAVKKIIRLSYGLRRRLNTDIAFLVASMEGHLEVVKFLVSEGFIPKGTNAFREASANGHLEIVKFFVSLGIKELQPDFQGDALIWASFHGRLEVVKYLGSLMSSDALANVGTAIVLASQKGHLEVIKYLVSLGVDIDLLVDKAVFWADVYNYFEVMEYLVSLGAPTQNLSERAKAYLAFCTKMKEKIRHRAAKKIYYWIIPKLYSPGSVSAYNLGMKGFEASMRGELI